MASAETGLVCGPDRRGEDAGARDKGARGEDARGEDDRCGCGSADLRGDLAFHAVIDLMEDDRFIAIQRRAMDRPMLWDEFLTMEMPSGMSPEQTWELLSVMRHQTAVWLPYRNDDGKSGWYSITRTMMEDFNAIDRYCCPDSWMAVTLSSRNMVYSLIEQLVRETVVALRDDGLSISYEETRRIFFGEQRPESPEGRVVSNIKGLILGPDSLKDAPIDEGLINEIHYRIADKCGHSTGGRRSYPEYAAWKNRKMHPRDAMRLIVNMANGMNVDPAQHPLLIASGIDSLFRLCEPLPSFNTAVSWIVRRLYFMRNRLPVLASVSCLSLEDDWNHGISKPRLLNIDFADSIVSLPDSVDFTAYTAGFVELVREELEKIDADLHRTIEGDAAFEEALQRDPEINYRQRSVLLRALEDPDAIFRIDAQQMTFNITYATARADLLKLEELGLLDRTISGRAFVFRPKPSFEQIIGRRWPEATKSKHGGHSTDAA